MPLRPDSSYSTAAATLEDGSGLEYGKTVSGAGDVNGDGYDDVVVGTVSGGPGWAYVYEGSSAGMDTTADAVLTDDGASTLFGYPVAGVGDLNGDGYDEVSIGWSGGWGAISGVSIHYGGAAGLSTTEATTLAGSSADDAFGCATGSADVNGDGYDDLLVGAYGASGQSGTLNVFHGGPDGLGPDADTILVGAPGDRFGLEVNGAGDLDGDGYEDVIVGAGEANLYTGYVQIFLGSSAGLLSTPALTLTGADLDSFFGRNADGAGDLNGDGYDDFVVWGTVPSSSGNDDYLYVYHGGATLDATSDAVLGSGGGWDIGEVVRGAGDVDGDGYDDLLNGSAGDGDGTGAACLIHGGPAGVADTPRTVLVGLVEGGHFGGAVDGAGDVNGDGYDDLIVGAYAANERDGQAMVFLGGAVSDTGGGDSGGAPDDTATPTEDSGAPAEDSGTPTADSATLVDGKDGTCGCASTTSSATTLGLGLAAALATRRMRRRTGIISRPITGRRS